MLFFRANLTSFFTPLAFDVLLPTITTTILDRLIFASALSSQSFSGAAFLMTSQIFQKENLTTSPDPPINFLTLNHCQNQS